MTQSTRDTENHLAPLHNNIVVCLVMILYFKLGTEVACWTRLRLKRGISRPLLHVLLSSGVIFWPYFDQSDWSWRLNALVPAVVGVRMIYKGGIVRDPGDAEVANMSLSNSPGDLLFGPSFLPLVMYYLGIYQFLKPECAIVPAAFLGDSLAPLIGSRYGRHLFQMPLGQSKTMEGSIVGVFLGTIMGCYFYSYMMGMKLLPLRMILAYSAIAAVAEATSPANMDNLVVPIVLHFSAERVQLLIPA